MSMIIPPSPFGHPVLLDIFSRPCVAPGTSHMHFREYVDPVTDKVFDYITYDPTLKRLWPVDYGAWPPIPFIIRDECRY